MHSIVMSSCSRGLIVTSLVPYGGKLWRMQALAKWQEKHHWWNKLWRFDDKSLIKRILKQFKDASAPNLSIRTHVCACMLLENDVGWLLSFSVESKIRGYHERNWNSKGNKEIHTIRSFSVIESKYPSVLVAVTPYSAALLSTSIC